VTGANGIFDVQVDGELVFTKSMLGRYPDPDDVVPMLRKKQSEPKARATVARVLAGVA
jgi:predicted Rdx family selenoprotein